MMSERRMAVSQGETLGRRFVPLTSAAGAGAGGAPRLSSRLHPAMPAQSRRVIMMMYHDVDDAHPSPTGCCPGAEAHIILPLATAASPTLPARDEKRFILVSKDSSYHHKVHPIIKRFHLILEADQPTSPAASP
jgi:hypothetical protein